MFPLHVLHVRESLGNRVSRTQEAIAATNLCTTVTGQRVHKSSSLIRRSVKFDKQKDSRRWGRPLAAPIVIIRDGQQRRCWQKQTAAAGHAWIAGPVRAGQDPNSVNPGTSFTNSPAFVRTGAVHQAMVLAKVGFVRCFSTFAFLVITP